MAENGHPFGFRKPDLTRYSEEDFMDPDDPDPPSEELTVEQWQATDLAKSEPEGDD